MPTDLLRDHDHPVAFTHPLRPTTPLHIVLPLLFMMLSGRTGAAPLDVLQGDLRLV